VRPRGPVGRASREVADGVHKIGFLGFVTGGNGIVEALTDIGPLRAGQLCGFGLIKVVTECAIVCKGYGGESVVLVPDKARADAYRARFVDERDRRGGEQARGSVLL